MTYLLDNSALIAWLLSKHPHNARILAWGKNLAASPDANVAVCAITELGFIRVACQVYQVSMADARKILQDWKDQRKPQFINCDISALDGIPSPSGKNSTDYYLCNLAEKHGMKWATFDEKCPHSAASPIP